MQRLEGIHGGRKVVCQEVRKTGVRAGTRTVLSCIMYHCVSLSMSTCRVIISIPRLTVRLLFYVLFYSLRSTNLLHIQFTFLDSIYSLIDLGLQLYHTVHIYTCRFYPYLSIYVYLHKVDSTRMCVPIRIYHPSIHLLYLHSQQPTPSLPTSPTPPMTSLSPALHSPTRAHRPGRDCQPLVPTPITGLPSLSITLSDSLIYALREPLS